MSGGTVDAYYRYNSQNYESDDDLNLAYSACRPGIRLVVTFGELMVIAVTQVNIGI
jgi:hypothetical protein